MDQQFEVLKNMMVYLIGILLSNPANSEISSLKEGGMSQLLEPISNMFNEIKEFLLNQASSKQTQDDVLSFNNDNDTLNQIPKKAVGKSVYIVSMLFIATFLSLFVRFGPQIYKNQIQIAKRVKYLSGVHTLQDASKALKDETLLWHKVVNPNFNSKQFERECVEKAKEIESEEEYSTLHHPKDIEIESDKDLLVQKYRTTLWNRFVRQYVLASDYHVYGESEIVFNTFKKLVTLYGFDENKYFENYNLLSNQELKQEEIQRLANAIREEKTKKFNDKNKMDALKKLEFFAQHAVELVALRINILNRKRELYNTYKKHIDVSLKPNYIMAKTLSESDFADL